MPYWTGRTGHPETMREHKKITAAEARLRKEAKADKTNTWFMVASKPRFAPEQYPVDPKSDDGIRKAMREKRYDNALSAIRARIRKTGVSDKVANAAMYYAYEQGHSCGEYEVCNIAYNMLIEVFEADKAG